jgi:hypothetical protein
MQCSDKTLFFLFFSFESVAAKISQINLKFYSALYSNELDCDMTKTPETINNADLTKVPTGTVNIKLHFNHKIVNYQCFTYKMPPAYGANVPTAIVDRDYYQTFKGDIDEIQIFHRVQVSRKILNLIKFGSKENA